MNHSQLLVKTRSLPKRSGRDIVYVYALVSHFGAFYVGKTCNPKSRYYRHLNDKASSKANPELRRMIAEACALGRIPDMIVLEVCTLQTWQEAEKFWIAYFRSCGCTIANVSNGGTSWTGRPMPMWHRIKISVANKAAANARRKIFGVACLHETREKISRANAGNKHALGYRHPTETRQRMSDIQKLVVKTRKKTTYKHSLATRLRMSANARRSPLWSVKPEIWNALSVADIARLSGMSYHAVRVHKFRHVLPTTQPATQ